MKWVFDEGVALILKFGSAAIGGGELDFVGGAVFIFKVKNEGLWGHVVVASGADFEFEGRVFVSCGVVSFLEEEEVFER